MSAILSEQQIDKTRQYNPSFNGIYKTDEEAVARAQAQHLMKLLREECPHIKNIQYYDTPTGAYKHKCRECWQAIWNEVMGEIP
jgi:hypothetical protein